MQRQRRGQTQLGIGVMMLASQLLNVGLDRIPPVTLATIVGQAALFLNLLKPPWRRRDACISVLTVLRQGDYKRILISTLEHADEWHLYYNMVSFLWKGMRLEQRFGSRKFAVLLAVFSVSCSLVYLALAKSAAELFQDDSYARQCAIGFSGVIFALKVLTHQYESGPDQWTYMRGLAVPARWAVWAELVIIHLLVPGASFIGHLAGILVGLAYTLGPLEYLIETLDKLIAVPLGRHETRHHRSSNSNSRSSNRGTSYTYHSGASGRREDSTAPGSGSGGGGRGSSYSTAPGSGSSDGGRGSSWGDFGQSRQGNTNPASPPPNYGWNVPPPSASPDPDPDQDPGLAEAIRRSRESHEEEMARRREGHQYRPSAPYPH